MQKIALLVVVLLALGVGGSLWAQGCHEGGGGCPMSGCPGSGHTMTDVSGKITYISSTHDVIKVDVAQASGGTTTVKLYVHPSCPNKDQLIKQIGGLKVGQTLKGSYYTLKDKTYLCTIGSSGSGSGGGSCH